jgi:D-sedoheptulose 7-phosphate isomerase
LETQIALRIAKEGRKALAELVAPNPSVSTICLMPKVAAFLQETIRLLERLDQAAVESAKELLLDCYGRRGRVYTAGNGGSASTAQHFACDLAKYVISEGARPFDVRCLTDNAPLYTAWANDADRDDVFVNQMRGLLTVDDVLIAISVHGGRGFSADLVRAVRFANETGSRTIALVGFDGGILHREATCSLLVPVDSTPQTEAIHLVIEHLLMFLIKDELAAR